ncbi:MAG: peroxidase-related enzyme, partial [Gammaproteobacteria bacterium]
MELMREDSGLSHLEHEMIALVSAATNGCVYCTAHHGALMRGETGDPLFAEYLSRNYQMAALSARHRAMLDFVVKVLTEAEHITDEDRQRLRDAGFDDEAIWMIISTAGFYAGANRIAQATGLRPAPQYLDMYREPAMKQKRRIG